MSIPKDPIAEAVAAESALVTSPSQSTETDKSNDYRSNLGHPKCFACGGVHGPVGTALLCLQLRIRRLETALRFISEGEVASLEGARAVSTVALKVGSGPMPPRASEKGGV